ncbi:DUF924 family protein [Solimonas terrae]|uniref:DUF924 domain-containing protein n=1 Tax=Solimonas terrae TaxID=1396819 RepID=A0A6M2BQH8_9GAMM|nr:DUF924 family protein [Solimonas terrae]NGY04604.1 DUF924 domain-containing protein [Solimonas terrae]
MAGAATPEDVVDFWFGAPGSPDRAQFRPQWFAVDAGFDDEIRSRFLPIWEQLQAGRLDGWRATPQGTLAYLIVADQFPRNCFRGSAQAFASDAQALQAARALVDAGGDTTLPPLQRCFVYLPFEHDESLAMQDRSVALFTALIRAHPELSSVLDFARRHREIILRFGRFPHRNAALGRDSTSEERAFLDEPGSSF